MDSPSPGIIRFFMSDDKTLDLPAAQRVDVKKGSR